MCIECHAFKLNSKPIHRNITEIISKSLAQSGLTNDRRRAEQPAHLFTCFNCSEVKDSLWIVSYIIEINAVDECLCCVECLCRNFQDLRFSREHKITLRCGGDGCNLKVDCWTKSTELIVSLLKEHTDKCPFRPVFCSRGCQSVVRRQDLTKHDDVCVLKGIANEREERRMEEVEQRLIVTPAKLRYAQMAHVPLTRRKSQNGTTNSDTSRVSPEAIRREALNYARRSSVNASDRNGQTDDYISPQDSLRQEVLNVSRRSYSSRNSISGTPKRVGVSDETLEQLEKARIALERQCIEVPDGVSYLPDVVAQRLNNDDKDAHQRLEQTEETLATTRAQLEKAFSEIRHLRALLNTENRLRELHVTKLREEMEFLKSYIYRREAATNDY